jgi:CBS domain-containing protein
MQRAPKAQIMSVKDLMTKQPQTVGPNDTTDTAARRMWEADCGALPVLDDDGVVLAMVTDRDICMAAWSRNQRPEELRVRDAMSTRLVTCGPSDPLETAEATMRLHQVRRLPVVDESKKLIGIISLADIALATARASHRELPRESDGVSTTLAIICEKSQLRSSPSSERAPDDSAPAPASAELQRTGDGKAA